MNNFAQTIINQLGGNRFIAMTDAKDFVKNEQKKNVIFKIGKNAMKITHVKITINAHDLYDVEFLNIRGFNEPKIISMVSNVQSINMRKVFSDKTGMYVSL